MNEQITKTVTSWKDVAPLLRKILGTDPIYIFIGALATLVAMLILVAAAKIVIPVVSLALLPRFILWGVSKYFPELLETS